MSGLNWDERAECPEHKTWVGRMDVSPCNADRAEMVAEGKRLQAEVVKWEIRCSAHRALGLTDMADLQAENARLNEQIEQARAAIEPARSLQSGTWVENIEMLVKYLDTMDAALAESEARCAAMREAIENVLPFLPGLDDGPVRYSAHAIAAGRLREALKGAGA